MTFLAALRHDRLTAPWLIDGPIDGQSFLQYVEEILVPTLKPGDIVIIDNLGSHKGNAIRQAIRAAGAKLFSTGSRLASSRATTKTTTAARSIASMPSPRNSD